MTQIVTGTYEDGVLKLDEALAVPAGSRVRVIVDTSEAPSTTVTQALDELDRLCDEFPIVAGGPRLTRDELHERG